MTEPQNYKNHVRYYPLVHYVIIPLLFLNLVWQIVNFSIEKIWNGAENVLMAVVFMLISMVARLQALRAQDRVIRLEERLRYKEILPADTAAQAAQLKIGKILALRFASDEELTELVQKTLNGELKTSKEIKQAIKNWRGDYLRV